MGNCIYDLGDLPGAPTVLRGGPPDLSRDRQQARRGGRARQHRERRRRPGRSRRRRPHGRGGPRDLPGDRRQAPARPSSSTTSARRMVMAGDYRGARARSSSRPCRSTGRLGDTGGLAIALNNVGELEMQDSNDGVGREELRAALEIFRDSGPEEQGRLSAGRPRRRRASRPATSPPRRPCSKRASRSAAKSTTGTRPPSS